YRYSYSAPSPHGLSRRWGPAVSHPDPPGGGGGALGERPPPRAPLVPPPGFPGGKVVGAIHPRGDSNCAASPPQQTFPRPPTAGFQFVVFDDDRTAVAEGVLKVVVAD